MASRMLPVLMARRALLRCFSLRFTLMMVVVTGLGSCTTVVPPTGKFAPGECGVALWMWSLEPSRSKYELYEVVDGTLAYGGGATALNRITNWTTPLTPAQCADLCAAVASTGWFATPPEETTSADRVEVVALTAEGTLTLRLPHWEPGLARLRSVLAAASQGRFQNALQRLPEASTPASSR